MSTDRGPQATAPAEDRSDWPGASDPYQWLEDVTGALAPSWVRERNAETVVELTGWSRFGADAVVVREFDIERREFVTDGFQLPEAKSSVDWIDADYIYVATDFGAEYGDPERPG